MMGRRRALGRPRPNCRAAAGASFVALALAACGGSAADQEVVRGKGLQAAGLPVVATPQVYEAAVRAAFDLGPSLVLLLHPRLLPRTAGLAGGRPVPAEVVSALRRDGVVQGSCEPAADSTRHTPRCEASGPGYVVRVSDVLRLAPDSLQVYLMAERFDTPASGTHQALRFEKVYQLAGRSGAWRVVREARVPDAARRDGERAPMFAAGRVAPSARRSR